MTKDKEARNRERFELNFDQKSAEELEKHEQEVEDFKCNEKEYPEEVEAMASDMRWSWTPKLA